MMKDLQTDNKLISPIAELAHVYLIMQADAQKLGERYDQMSKDFEAQGVNVAAITAQRYAMPCYDHAQLDLGGCRASG